MNGCMDESSPAPLLILTSQIMKGELLLLMYRPPYHRAAYTLHTMLSAKTDRQTDVENPQPTNTVGFIELFCFFQ